MSDPIVCLHGGVMKSIKSLAIAFAAGVLLTVGYSANSQAAACASSGSYQDLMNVGSCEIGDKTFSGFLFGSTTGFTAAEIHYNAINGVNGFWGFDFTFNIVVQTPAGPNPS